MTNLKLITTETFGDLPCNFYRNLNDDILLTRNQIGEALEYTDPSKAIRKIHLKHKDRLEPLCMRMKLDGSTHFGANLTKSEEQECVYYTQRGVMEICRFSRQPLADKFMDWVWDIVESYRTGELYQSSQPNIEVLNTLNNITTTLSSITDRLTKLETQTTKPTLPIPKYSRWKSITFEKFKLLMNYVNNNSDQDLSLANTMNLVFKEVQNTYNVDFADYTYMYKCELGLPEDEKIQTLDVINHYKDLKDMFNLTLDTILEKLHIQTEKSNVPRNIFNVLAEKLQEQENKQL